MIRVSSNPKYNRGGWLKDNWGSVAQTALGGAAMAIPGLQNIGAGMLAQGVGGMLTPTPEAPTQDTSYNDWIVNNRHHNMNNRRMSPSMFFQHGGRISKMRPDPMSVTQDPTRGGKLEKEASNVRRAVGNTHEQGGIELPAGEIEHNESLVTSPYNGEVQVHSDELGYADQTNELAEYKGQLEQELSKKVQTYANLMDEQNKLNARLEETGNKFKQNSIKREFDKLANHVGRIQSEMEGLQFEISQIDAQIEEQFQMQEQEKAMMGIEQGMEGDMEQGMGEEMFQFGGTMTAPNRMKPFYYGKPGVSNDAFYGTDIRKGFAEQGVMLDPDTNDFVNTGMIFPNTMFEDHNVNVVGRAHPNPGYTPQSRPVSNNPRLLAPPSRMNSAPGTISQNRSPQDLVDVYMASAIPEHKSIDPMKGVSKLIPHKPGDIHTSRSSIPSLNSPNPIEGGVTVNRGSMLKDMMPYADNIVNAFLNKRLSGMDVPTMDKVSTPTLDANVNINAQLENVASQTAAANEFIQGNINSAPMARASHAATRVQNIQMVNSLYGEKHNAETQIRNQNLQLAAETDYRNATIGYQNDMMRYNQEVAGIERTSQNIANAVSKHNQKETQDRLKEYQEKQLAVLEKQYAGTSIHSEMREAMKLVDSKDNNQDTTQSSSTVESTPGDKALTTPARTSTVAATSTKESPTESATTTAPSTQELHSNLNTFKDTLGARESNNKYDANRPGSQYLGKYQFGNAALIDLGFKNKDGEWDNEYNITSAEEFLNNPDIQEKAMEKWTKILDRRLKDKGAYDKWVGKEFEGIKITENGLRAIAHLQGVAGALRALENNENTADGLGTTITDYLKLFV